MLQLLPFFYYGQQDTKLREHRPALATCTLESESIRMLWTEVLETLTHWTVRKYIKSPIRISWRFNRDLSELLSILSSGEADFALRLPSLKGPTRLEQFQSSLQPLHPEKERRLPFLLAGSSDWGNCFLKVPGRRLLTELDWTPWPFLN